VGGINFKTYSCNNANCVLFCGEVETGQWNRMKNPEINKHTNKPNFFSFNKGVKEIKWKKENFHSKQW
jgi:hypothetical protein